MTYFVSERKMVAVKDVTTVRTNTATLASDPELTIRVEANTTYTIRMDLAYASTTLGGFKMGFTAPSGSVLRYTDMTNTPGVIQGITDLLSLAGSGTDRYLFVSGLLRTGAAAGQLTLQWAEAAAVVGTSATVYADSSITMNRTKP